eukprot:gene22992-biopygen23785
MEQHRTSRSNTEQHGTARNNTEQHGTARNNTKQCGAARDSTGSIPRAPFTASRMGWEANNTRGAPQVWWVWCHACVEMSADGGPLHRYRPAAASASSERPPLHPIPPHITLCAISCVAGAGQKRKRCRRRRLSRYLIGRYSLGRTGCLSSHSFLSL